MLQRIDAEAAQRIEVEFLDFHRRRLEDDLKLVVVLQAVRVLTVAAIGRPAGGLDVGHVPRFGAERAQEGRRMEGPGAFFHIVRLLDDTALVGPVVLQGQNQFLESHISSNLTQAAGPPESILYTVKIGRSILNSDTRPVKVYRRLRGYRRHLLRPTAPADSDR